VDSHTCDDRISPSEWDAGGYFDAEFVVNGRLMLYAHFEQVEGRIVESGGGIAGNGSLDYEEDKTWYWGTYGDKGLKNKARTYG
jgi:hypothetical protein